MRGFVFSTAGGCPHLRGSEGSGLARGGRVCGCRFRTESFPPALAGRSFSLADGRARVVARARLLEADLVVSFRGVRSRAATPLGARTLVEAFAWRRPANHVISHTTALLLWGAPLPRRIEQQGRIHVSSLDGVTPRANR